MSARQLNNSVALFTMAEGAHSSQLTAAQDKDQVKIKTKIKIEVFSSHHNVKQQHTGIQKLRSKLKCNAVSLDSTLGV